MMSIKRALYFLSKVTLIDEILGFMYWALALYGLFKAIGHWGDSGSTLVWLVLGISIYVVLIVVVYIYGLRRLAKFFKPDRRA